MHTARGWDIIGDVHGCFVEMMELTNRLGYTLDSEGVLRHPEGRCLAWVGDIVDRGPNVVEALTIVRATMEAGVGVMVLGNHEEMYLDWYFMLTRTMPTHTGNMLKRDGTDVTIAAIRTSDDTQKYWADWIATLNRAEFLHLESTAGPIVFLSHAGIGLDKLYMDGGVPMVPNVNSYPLRYEIIWNRDDEYWGPTYEDQNDFICVYGHTPWPAVTEVVRGKTFNIDTGCYYGNALSALRFPELQIVSVDSVTNPNPWIIGRNVHV